MRKAILIFLILVIVTGCRTRKDIQIDKAEYSYQLQLDSLASDSSIEYTEIERIYYSPDTTGGFNNPRPLMTEKIKNFKKTGSRVEVRKEEEKAETHYSKSRTKDRQTGRLDFSLWSLVLLVVLFLAFWWFRKT